MRYCSECAALLAGPPPVTCKRCGARFWDNPRVCAGALVEAEGRVLLLRRAMEPWLDHWDIPGGFCEPREHPADTAARETLEETGCVIDVVGLYGIWLDASHGPDVAPLVVIYFIAHPAAGTRPPAAGSEAREIGWFAGEALPAPLAFPSHVSAVLAAWAGGAAPPARIRVRGWS
jgi:ADP-ribose pyrophosphatase YjhB (NUDIX family)